MVKKLKGPVSLDMYADESSMRLDQSVAFSQLKGNEAGKIIIKLPLADIRRDANQPRKRFDEDKLRELADSMKERGLLIPIIVRKEEDGYVIIAGERRYRAAQILGWNTIECIVRNEGREDARINSFVENLQREDLSSYEEAEGFELLQKEFGKTQAQIAELVSKDQTTISKIMKILTMPPKAYIMAKENNVDIWKALKVLELSNERLMLEAIKRIIDNQATVSEADKIVDSLAKKKPGRPKDSVTLKLGKSTRSFIKSADNYFKKHVGMASQHEKQELEKSLIQFQAKIELYIKQLHNDMVIDGAKGNMFGPEIGTEQ